MPVRRKRPVSFRRYIGGTASPHYLASEYAPSSRRSAEAVPGAQVRLRIDRAASKVDLEVQMAPHRPRVPGVADVPDDLADVHLVPGVERRRVDHVVVEVLA